MRKEITGLLLFFLVIFTLISLLTYHPHDPSVHNAARGSIIHNQFGLVGAHVAGFLIGLFGLGAFWAPLLLLLASINFFGGVSPVALAAVGGGGLLLMADTGALLTLAVAPAAGVALFGVEYSAGGMIGMPLAKGLVAVCKPTGAGIILIVLWLIGLIITTGFSLIRFGGRILQASRFFIDRIQTARIKRIEHRKKAIKRVKTQKKAAAVPKAPIQIRTPKPAPKKPMPRPKQETFSFMGGNKGTKLPPVSFLEDPPPRETAVDDDNLTMLSRLLEKKLDDFGVRGKVMAVSPGPVITTFEYAPAAGVKINKIVSLTDDLALALRATSIRIVAPIPGKAAVGIEVPNTDREIVHIKEIIASSVFDRSKSFLPLCLGKDIVGNPVVAELEKMPHLLIAGATGTGKSVGLNAMISSILYKSTPDQVKMIMVDPKRIELNLYDGIPHLITPVVTDAKKATNALFWAVREMERRYALLAEVKARNLAQYNKKMASKKAEPDQPPPEQLPLIVIVIDELADLMMVASRDVEVALTRLAQMARAAGIHLILATQRPSVDVLTGIIKANFPTRLTFQVSSRTDSRTILDANGAENLLGNGDMLLMPPGTAKLQRVHGAYISEAELTQIVQFLKDQQTPDYDESILSAPAPTADANADEDYDERYDDAVALVSKMGQASISMVQRHLRIGYNRAARIIETMEREGVVGPSDGAKPREVLVRNYDAPE